MADSPIQLSPRYAARVVRTVQRAEKSLTRDERLNYGTPAKPLAIADEFWVKLTGASVLGSNRWKYDWEEWKRSASGWVQGDHVSTDGTGGTADTRALNSQEDGNTGTGIEGNDINVSGLPGSFALLPLTANNEKAVFGCYRNRDGEGGFPAFCARRIRLINHGQRCRLRGQITVSPMPFLRCLIPGVLP